MRKGVWERIDVDGSRHLVDRDGRRHMRLPGFDVNGSVTLLEADGHWQPIGDASCDDPDEGWRLLRGAVPLADGTVVVSNGVIRRVHEPYACAPGTHRQAPCWIHRPSTHHLIDWPIVWQDYRSVAERVCTHGIGHPDPDQVAFAREAQPRPPRHDVALHACDGCCSPD